MQENDEIREAREQLEKNIEQIKQFFGDIQNCKNRHLEKFARPGPSRIQISVPTGLETTPPIQDIITGEESLYRMHITMTWQCWEVFEQKKYRQERINKNISSKRKDLGVYLFGIIRNCILHHDGDVLKFKDKSKNPDYYQQGEYLYQSSGYLTTNGNLYISKDGLEKLLKMIHGAIEKSKII